MAGVLRLNKRHTRLPGQEKALVPVRGLRLDHLHCRRARSAFLANGHSILVLHESLRDSDAILANRLDCLNDPNVHSNCQIKYAYARCFERNGGVGEEICAGLPVGAEMDFHRVEPAATAHGHD